MGNLPPVVSKTPNRKIYKPNNRASDRFVVYDWLDSCILMLKFRLLINVLKAKLTTGSAPLLHSDLSVVKNCDKLCSVNAVYVHICQFFESFPSGIFSFSEYSMKLFTARSLFFLTLQARKNEIDSNDIELLWKNLVDIVAKSTANKKKFKPKTSEHNECT